MDPNPLRIFCFFCLNSFYLFAFVWVRYKKLLCVLKLGVCVCMLLLLENFFYRYELSASKWLLANILSSLLVFYVENASFMDYATSLLCGIQVYLYSSNIWHSTYISLSWHLYTEFIHVSRSPSLPPSYLHMILLHTLCVCSFSPFSLFN